MAPQSVPRLALCFASSFSDRRSISQFPLNARRGPSQEERNVALTVGFGEIPLFRNEQSHCRQTSAINAVAEYVIGPDAQFFRTGPATEAERIQALQGGAGSWRARVFAVCDYEYLQCQMRFLRIRRGPLRPEATPQRHTKGSSG